jgi:hypothetical protein
LQLRKPDRRLTAPALGERLRDVTRDLADEIVVRDT